MDAKAEAPIVWPPDVKNWLIGKDPNAGKDWRREKGMTDDEMDGWHHRLKGHEFEQALEVGDGQGSLLCCSPWGCKELDMTKRLNWLIHPWYHYYNQGTKCTCYFQKFLSVPLCVCVCVCVCIAVGRGMVVVRKLNKRSILLTYFKVHNTVLLTTGTMLNSRYLEFIDIA